MSKLGEEYTIFILQNEGYTKGHWFDVENYGTDGKEAALEDKAQMIGLGGSYRVISKTVIEREIFE